MPNTNAMKKSFGYRGAETWNSLPVELKFEVTDTGEQWTLRSICIAKMNEIFCKIIFDIDFFRML